MTDTCTHPTESCYACAICRKDAGCLTCGLEWHDTVECKDLVEPRSWHVTEEDIKDLPQEESAADAWYLVWLKRQSKYVRADDLADHGFTNLVDIPVIVVKDVVWYKAKDVIDMLSNR